MLSHEQKRVLQSIVEQAIYANFNEKERKHIDIKYHVNNMVDNTEDFITLMIEEISYNLSQIKPDPYEDSLENKETDIWYAGE